MQTPPQFEEGARIYDDKNTKETFNRNSSMESNGRLQIDRLKTTQKFTDRLKTTQKLNVRILFIDPVYSQNTSNGSASSHCQLVHQIDRAPMPQVTALALQKQLHKQLRERERESN